jgi:hypothetical protein
VVVRDPLEHQVQQDQVVLKVQQEQKDLLVVLGLPVLLVLKDQLDLILQVKMVPKVQEALKVQLGALELKAL